MCRKKSGQFSWNKLVAAFLASALCLTTTVSPVMAQTLPTVLNLPVPGTLVPLSQAYQPSLLKGLSIDPEDPLHIDFIVDSGEDHLQGEALKTETLKMVKYFLAALTIPENQMWVNLSPYERNRIVSKNFGDTLMGRDLLAEDYLLKQLSSSLMYPEDEEGRKFWQRVRQKAYEKFGTTDVPLNTFNKIWIVPEKAVVYTHGNRVFVVNSKLKVMLEEDYLALNKHRNELKKNASQADDVLTGVELNVVREVLLPEIEKEINHGKNFAQLRQIYNAVILAKWYKANLKQSFLGQAYVDQSKTTGIDTSDKTVNQKIWEQYVASFHKGVYNYIKEEPDPVTKEMVPRKYFSGGASLKNVPLQETQDPEKALRPAGDMAQVAVRLETTDWDSQKTMVIARGLRGKERRQIQNGEWPLERLYQKLRLLAIQQDELQKRSGRVTQKKINGAISIAINKVKADKVFVQEAIEALEEKEISQDGVMAVFHQATLRYLVLGRLPPAVVLQAIKGARTATLSVVGQDAAMTTSVDTSVRMARGEKMIRDDLGLFLRNMLAHRDILLKKQKEHALTDFEQPSFQFINNFVLILQLYGPAPKKALNGKRAITETSRQRQEEGVLDFLESAEKRPNLPRLAAFARALQGALKIKRDAEAASTIAAAAQEAGVDFDHSDTESGILGNTDLDLMINALYDISQTLINGNPYISEEIKFIPSQETESAQEPGKTIDQETLAQFREMIRMLRVSLSRRIEDMEIEIRSHANQNEEDATRIKKAKTAAAAFQRLLDKSRGKFPERAPDTIAPALRALTTEFKTTGQVAEALRALKSKPVDAAMGTPVAPKILEILRMVEGNSSDLSEPKAPGELNIRMTDDGAAGLLVLPEYQDAQAVAQMLVEYSYAIKGILGVRLYLSDPSIGGALILDEATSLDLLRYRLQKTQYNGRVSFFANGKPESALRALQGAFRLLTEAEQRGTSASGEAEKSGKTDEAMNADQNSTLGTEAPGGIDMDPSQFEIEENGNGGLIFPKLKPGAALLDIRGVRPTITGVTPITNLPLLLGLQKTLRKAAPLEAFRTQKPQRGA